LANRSSMAGKHVALNSKRAGSMPRASSMPAWMAGHTAVSSPRPVLSGAAGSSRGVQECRM
jgi:hypothetical protein